MHIIEPVCIVCHPCRPNDQLPPLQEVLPQVTLAFTSIVVENVEDVLAVLVLLEAALAILRIEHIKLQILVLDQLGVGHTLENVDRFLAGELWFIYLHSICESEDKLIILLRVLSLRL